MRIVVIGIVLGIGLVLAELLRSSQRRASGVNFEGQVYANQLLNKAGLTLYRTLLKACPECLVFSQVALSQLIGLRRGAPRALTNRYYRLVADFVICDQEGKPIAVIELDGRWHDSTRQSERDGRKDQILGAAKIPIVRLKPASIPEAAELRACISRATRQASA